jgi:site-specific DNA-methyltransferase (adenine-specific)
VRRIDVHRIYEGDVRQIITKVEPESIDLIVTSPPYYDIKDYGIEGQIGYSQSYNEYLSDLMYVFCLSVPLLKSGCRMAINIGDVYVSATDESPFHVLGIPADIVSHLSKLEDIHYRGSIIWNKISTTNPSGGGSWMGSTYYPKDGQVTFEHEYILIFRKTGDWERPGESDKEKSRLTKEERSDWFRGLWSIPGETSNNFPAAFPVEIPRRLIKMYSFYGETILDPFVGSGTTSVAAEETGRDSIGIELNPEYTEIIKSRVSDAKLVRS